MRKMYIRQETRGQKVCAALPPTPDPRRRRSLSPRLISIEHHIKHVALSNSEINLQRPHCEQGFGNCRHLNNNFEFMSEN
jgi:hypothetical protein